MAGGAIRSGLPSTVYKSASTTPPSNNPNFPVSAGQSPTRRPQSSVQANGAANSSSGSVGSSVFGTVPSQFEIERAIAALAHFMLGISSSGSEMNWMQLFGCQDPRTLLSSGFGRVSRAFHLLQREPSIKGLVISLALDRALWDAIMNNESVRKLGESLYSAESRQPRITEEGEAEAYSESNNLTGLLDIMTEKIFELVEKFKSLVNEMFQKNRSNHASPTTETAAQLEEKMRSSVLLSVVILLIVILARVHGV